jgi:NDP-sugar pyrophosphorylase family protein
MKGMVLAAGYGTRLRPLTELLPKPLFPAVNMPLVDFGLHRLSTVGVDSVIVNLHHLPDPIRAHLAKGSRFGQTIEFSEEPTILGTGGGIKAIREWVGNDTLCVTNGDTIYLAALEPVVNAHKASGASATLALMPVKDPGRFSAVEVDTEGRIVDVGGRLKPKGDFEPGVFAGFHILSPEVFDHMPDKNHFCIVRDVYLPMIQDQPGSVRAVFAPGKFYDMGTPEDYLTGNLALLAQHIQETSELTKGLRHLGDRVFIGSNPTLGRGVNLIGPCVIGDDVQIEGGSQIGPLAAVGDGARLGPWSRIQHSVVWPNAFLPGGGQYTNAIIYDRDSISIDMEIEKPV